MVASVASVENVRPDGLLRGGKRASLVVREPIKTKQDNTIVKVARLVNLVTQARPVPARSVQQDFFRTKTGKAVVTTVLSDVLANKRLAANVKCAILARPPLKKTWLPRETVVIAKSENMARTASALSARKAHTKMLLAKQVACCVPKNSGVNLAFQMCPSVSTREN